MFVKIFCANVSRLAWWMFIPLVCAYVSVRAFTLSNAFSTFCIYDSLFITFAVFRILYSFFWVIPRLLQFMCRRFGTPCSVLIAGVSRKNTAYEDGMVRNIDTQNSDAEELPKKRIQMNSYFFLICCCLRQWRFVIALSFTVAAWWLRRSLYHTVCCTPSNQLQQFTWRPGSFGYLTI